MATQIDVVNDDAVQLLIAVQAEVGNDSALHYVRR
jgi:hypothetical protein